MRLKTWQISTLLFLFATLLYVRMPGGEFLRWDDRQNIQLNPFVERALWSQTWTRSYYNMYIPVTYSVWTVLWHLTPEPWIFHLLNILLHGGTVVLVYLIARRILRRPAAAAFAAVLFAAHPLQVETVAWISTGRDLLASFLALAATYLVMAHDRRRWWAIATGLFVLALLSKPSVAVIPVGAATLAWAAGALDRRRLYLWAGWLVPGAAALIATKIIQQLDADLRVPRLPVLDRALVSFDTLWFYSGKLLVPIGLASDYGRTPLVVLAERAWIPGLVVGVVLLALAVRYRRHVDRLTFAAVAWTLVFFGPVTGLVPFQAQGQSTVADRYAYLPMLGVALLFGRLAARHRVLAGVLLVILSGASVVRAETWRTNYAFFHDMLLKNPVSFVANSSLGVEYILREDYPTAERFLNEAVRLKPNDIIPRTNLAQLFLLLKRPERVTSEVAPLLDDVAFLHQNQTETRALASAYRLTARAYWIRGIYLNANDHFCRWFHLDFENEDGKAEVQRFLADAKLRQVELTNCEFRPGG